MINQIAIDNFKGIARAEVKFNRVNAIIGRNGSGKSTLIAALVFLQKLIENGDLPAAVATVSPHRSEFFHYGSPIKTASIKATITVGNKNYIFGIRFSLKKVDKKYEFWIDEETLYEITSGVRTEKMIYRRDIQSVTTSEESNTKELVLITKDKLFLNSSPQIEAITLVKTISSYTIINSVSIHSLGLELMPKNKLDSKTIEGQLISIYTKDQDLYQKVLRLIKTVIPEFEPPMVVNVSQSNEVSKAEKKKEEEIFWIRWKEDFFEQYLTSNSLSGGNWRTILLILSLFNTAPYSLLAFEEIENGLYPGRVGRLIDLLKTEAFNRKVQLVFTTHSPEILQRLLVEEVIYCKRDEKNSSIYETLSDTEQYSLIKDDLKIKHAGQVLNSGMFD